jgi:predicted hotdog family 3-hydroxylacyl-ACP dehydratase
MAQSISVLTGLDRTRKLKAGCLLSVTGLKATEPVLRNGTTAKILVREDCCIDEVYTFDCAVTCGPDTAKQIVSAKITVMDVNDFSLLTNQ